MRIINKINLNENAEIDYGLPDDFDDAQNHSSFDASTLIDMSTECTDNFVNLVEALCIISHIYTLLCCRFV